MDVEGKKRDVRRFYDEYSGPGDFYSHVFGLATIESLGDNIDEEMIEYKTFFMHELEGLDEEEKGRRLNTLSEIRERRIVE